MAILDAQRKVTEVRVEKCVKLRTLLQEFMRRPEFMWCLKPKSMLISFYLHNIRQIPICNIYTLKCLKTTISFMCIYWVTVCAYIIPNSFNKVETLHIYVTSEQGRKSQGGGHRRRVSPFQIEPPPNNIVVKHIFIIHYDFKWFSPQWCLVLV